MTSHREPQSASEDLGGVPFIKPGQQRTDAKLPNPAPASAKLTAAWEQYMLNGFTNNERMFKRTLEAFMRPYNITVGMYVILFIIGIVFFSIAVFQGLNNDQSLVAIGFGGLSVASFVLFFIRQPVQALEENLEFITWLGVAFNTYWTRLMYMQNQDTIQAELKAATDDYSNTVERLINKHAELRGKRSGGDLSTAPPEAATVTTPEQPSVQDQATPAKPAPL